VTADAPRTLARCTQSSNCPSVEQLPDGRIAVTGEWHCADPETGETTVTIPAEVFEAAAKAWLDAQATETRTEWATRQRWPDGTEEVGSPVSESLARTRVTQFPGWHKALMRREVRYGPWTEVQRVNAYLAHRTEQYPRPPADRTVRDFRGVRATEHPRTIADGPR
jgi:hypothetical protein